MNPYLYDPGTSDEGIVNLFGPTSGGDQVDDAVWSSTATGAVTAPHPETIETTDNDRAAVLLGTLSL